MTSLLPPTNLGRWLLVVSILAVGNSISGFISTSSSRQSYSTTRGLTQLTPLQSRHYSLWTLTAGIVRLYTAYHPYNKELYHLTLATFAIVLLHLFTEIAIFKTASIKAKGIVSATVVATISSVAMLASYGSYVGK